MKGNKDIMAPERQVLIKNGEFYADLPNQN